MPFLLLVVGLGLYSCFSDTKENILIEIQITGNHYVYKDEILNSIDWKPGIQYNRQLIHSWEKQLLQNPRIESVNWKFRYGRLELKIQEREPIGILHTHGDIYEFSSQFYILSKNDVRATWVPIISGDFPMPSIEKNFYSSNPSIPILEVSQSPAFRSLWNQSQKIKEKYPLLWQRISEIQLKSDGDIYIYFHEPLRFLVNMGSFLSNRQLRKLQSSVAFFETQSIPVHYLDLRGEDGFYY